MKSKNAEAVILAVVLWFVTYLVIGDNALPGEPLFPMVALFVAANFGGLIQRIQIKSVAIPGLLGMIIVGAVLRNTGALKGRSDDWSSAMRTIALGIILTRGGLALDLSALKTLGRPTVLMSCLPVLGEAVTDLLLAKALTDLPWAWCCMLGFILAAISPAVIVPHLTELQVLRYGTQRGIPSMLLVASGVDVVIAVTGFGICYGIAFESSLALSVAKGPIDIAIGFAASGALAYMYAKLFDSDLCSDGFKAALFLLTGIACTFGFGKLGYSGGGALATMLMGAFVQKLTSYDIKALNQRLADSWDLVAKPLLFGLIGAAIDVETLTGRTVRNGVIILFGGLVVRLAMVNLSIAGKDLTRNERIFVTLAWVPKATVQAALGPSVLDYIRDDDDATPEEEDWAQQILTMSVLAILIAAPLGAAFIE
eukprot:gene787-1208_t